MHTRISLSTLLFLFCMGCSTEPEPNEFTQIRQDMQKRQELIFATTVKKLEERKKNSYKRSYRAEPVIDPEEELKIQKEAERKRWLAVKIDEEEAEDWKALGLSPKNASRWKKTGLSYNTIAVLLRKDVLPSEAVEFMNKKFTKHPRAFILFAEPLFQFQLSCEKVLEAKSKEFTLINKKCKDYVHLLELSMISGYLADEYKDNDLSLEYVSKLRQADSQKLDIQKRMEKKSQESMINADRKNFALLFPILERSPTKEEMFFVKQHNLPLQNTKRYKSYEYYEFWINKDKEEEKARVAAIKQQQALKRAKIARLKAEAYRMKALAYNKMVASECGELVTAEPSTGEKVHVEGSVQYVIGKIGSNIFAYVVKHAKDGKSYLIRDPNAKKAVKVSDEVSWTALTVGRVVSVTLDDDGTASYNHYSQEDKEFYPMLKLVSTCPYRSKSLLQR